ncbi:hypothetical protein SeMB42_g05799 [Synchytrium endobioticum]|uniref:RRM domain-containing protein n=1 Tax=Synchytrium endobioticum TaxID=286115 RepID=A0A507D4W2_9FUNG|nr:hypothetical protein SeMB42_g05799 [Synchytrium endobioticum]TPX46278.1 hypothetical protein SeLEV6574_g03298 [Synchytrium endobioticum]
MPTSDTSNSTSACSSRLVVKNVPSYYTQDKLRAHFAKRFEAAITDVKLVTTPDGTSRRFAYIGFKSDKDATAAKLHYDNSFIDTARLLVDYAKPIGDASLPRPWSKYSTGSSAYAKTHDSLKSLPLTEKDIIKARNEAAKQQRLAHQTKLMQALKEAESDPKFLEFMEAMRPRNTTGRTWANDDLMTGSSAGPSGSASTSTSTSTSRKKRKATDLAALTSESNDESLKKVKFADYDEDQYQSLPTASATNSADSKSAEYHPPGNNKSRSNNHESADDDQDSNLIEADCIANDPAVSDWDYFKSKVSKTLDKEDGDNDEENEMDVEEEVVEKRYDEQMLDIPSKKVASVDNPVQKPNDSDEPQTQLSPADIISDTGRLFIKNLAFACTQSDLESLLSPFGPLSEVHISINKQTLQPKGYAFITYMIPEHALKAYMELDGKIFMGRILEVLPGKEKLVLGATDQDEDGMTFKEKREKQRRADAGNSFTWNTLFMNSDAVVEAMAQSMNVPKSAILDPTSADMAVRLALAETHVINETKQFLIQNDVSLDAFESGMSGGAKQKKQRSDTVILVKNIPATTVEEEVGDLFEKFGTLGRVLLPPARTLALVEFLHPTEAKVAFRSLAYTKFKYLPLFLEWAPIGTFISRPPEPSPTGSTGSNVASSNNNTKEALPVTSLAEPPSTSLSVLPKPLAEKEDEELILSQITTPTTTLFIKNLNFDTSETSLKAIFPSHEFPSLKSVRIATKPDKKNAGKTLSMGFGFVEFGVKADAAKALKMLQGHVLDQHALALKVSHAGSQKSVNYNRNTCDAAAQEPNGTKVVVRNIPFEASKKDVRALFSTFGKVKSLRLPLKFDGSHRGFGFIEFITKQEALNAFQSLHATHLYGRHLVLEWAKNDDEVNSVEATRERTKKEYTSSVRGVGRKKGKVLIGDEGGDE